jgi:hypothetical protein
LPLKCRKKFLVARSVDNLLVPDIPQIFSWFLDNGFAETKTQISVWFSALESSWWWFDRLLLVGSKWCRACQEAHFVLWKIILLKFLLHCLSVLTSVLVCIYLNNAAVFVWHKVRRFYLVRGLQNAQRKILLEGHRKCFCWLDEWHGLTMEDVRKMEDDTAQAISRVRHHFHFPLFYRW